MNILITLDSTGIALTEVADFSERVEAFGKEYSHYATDHYDLIVRRSNEIVGFAFSFADETARNQILQLLEIIDCCGSLPGILVIPCKNSELYIDEIQGFLEIYRSESTKDVALGICDPDMWGKRDYGFDFACGPIQMTPKRSEL